MSIETQTKKIMRSAIERYAKENEVSNLFDKMSYDEVNGVDREEMIKKYGEENFKLYLEFFENLESKN